jgi:hypothetical protein
LLCGSQNNTGRKSWSPKCHNFEIDDIEDDLSDDIYMDNQDAGSDQEVEEEEDDSNREGDTQD